MADFGGGLNIRLSAGAEGVRVVIASSRPVGASRVFAGRTPVETAARLPRLYSVCATAQAAACAAACEAAQGIAPDPAVTVLRRRLVDAETVKEHLWRLLLDWPRFLGSAPDAPAMAAVMQAFAGFRAGLCAGGDPFAPGAAAPAADADGARGALEALAAVTAGRVLGAPPAEWLEGADTAAGFLAWAEAGDGVAARLIRAVRLEGWERLGAAHVPPLPALAPTDLEAPLAAPDAGGFVAAPTWEGGPRETSPFTRMLAVPAVAELAGRFGSGLLPRLAARLTELARLQAALALGPEDACTQPLGAPSAPGAGIALVPAARGLLAHRAAVRDGVVEAYRILAPTEWNFHPEGAAARGLAGLPPADADTLRRQAGMLVTAVDPCVEYDVRLM